MSYIFSEPCEIVKYEAKTLSYDKYSSLSVVPQNQIMNSSNLEERIGKELMDSKYVYFYYSTTEVPVLYEEFILDFCNFVSAIGGNLGMFIGFSFLGFLSWLFLMIEKLFSMA